MTGTVDRFFAGLTVGVGDGPDTYRAAGWILRIMAIVTLAGAGFGLLALLFVAPFLILVGSLGGPGFITSLTLGFGAVMVAGFLAGLVFLLVVNHLHIGWSGRASWALWGTRAFTGFLLVSSVWPLLGAGDASDAAAAISGVGVGGLTLLVLHVLTWTEGTRQAFEEGGDRGEGPEEVDAVLETGD